MTKERLLSDGVSFDIFDSRDISENSEILIADLTKITADALGRTEERMLPRIIQRVSSFDLIVRGMEGQEPVGYGGYRIFDHNGAVVLYESAKMSLKRMQGRGVGSRTTVQAVQQAEPDVLTFRTQNPAEVVSVRNAIPGIHLAPFDSDFSHFGDDFLPFMQDRLGIDDLDYQTGVCRESYGERFGDYEVNNAHPKILVAEQAMQALGIRRDRGDAFFVAGNL